MLRTCSVCADGRHAAVDQALVGGVAVDEIARRYPPLSATSLRRHRAEHIAKTVQKAQEATEIDHGLDVVKQLRAINGVTMAILSEARRSGNGELALKAIDRIERQITLQGRLIGDLDEGATNVNVLVASPEWLATRGALIAALRPFPDARAAVVAELLKLEGGR